MPTVYEKMLEVRQKTDLSLKPNQYLKNTFTGFDGLEHPLKLRNYQIQMVLHLMANKRFLVGEDMGLGKTLEMITFLTYLWSKDPDTKVVVVTTKSATPQWCSEFTKFARDVNTFLCQGTPKQREKARDKFLQSSGPSVLAMGYRTAVQDFTELQGWQNHVLIFDEATNFKNPQTQVHQVCRHLASQASRVYGLTGTLIKNHLMEGFGIFRVIHPEALCFKNDDGTIEIMNQQKFMYYFCIVEMMSIPRSPKKIPKIVGYLPERVREFRTLIDPFYLGRAKHEVATELPTLTTKTIPVTLNKAEESKYREALAGLLTVGEKGKIDLEEKDVTKLTALIYCQQIVNHLDLIDCEGGSEKLDTLIDLLTDGELAGEKVIIFSRFKKMIDLIVPALEALKIKTVRVTGDETDKQRDAAKNAFQNPNDPTQVICITTAGSDALNLQAAKAVVLYDSPWSAGEYLQLLGRMLRIGSTHTNVYAIHLVAKMASKMTIDEQVMKTISKKMHLLDAVLGKRIKGEEDVDEAIIGASSDINDLFASLREDASDLVPKALPDITKITRDGLATPKTGKGSTKMTTNIKMPENVDLTDIADLF